MEQPTIPSAAANETGNTPWSEADAVELWKYFGSVGGGDKNTMVQVCNLLLGFSVAIVAFAFGKDIDKSILGGRFVCWMAFFGLLISIASTLVSLIYGGDANWNWAKADQIARIYGWSVLYPDLSR